MASGIVGETVEEDKRNEEKGLTGHKGGRLEIAGFPGDRNDLHEYGFSSEKKFYRKPLICRSHESFVSRDAIDRTDQPVCSNNSSANVYSRIVVA